MYCTLISLIIATFLIYEPIRVEGFPDVRVLGIVLIILSFLFFFVHLLIRALAWRPLQKAENLVAPRLIEIYDNDFTIRSINFLIRLFPLLTLLITSDLLITGLIPKNYLIAIWIILLGLVLDALHQYIKRFQQFLDPFQAVKVFSQAAKQSIADEKEGNLLNWIDGLNEIAIKAIQNSNTTLANHAVEELQGIAKNFLEASKSISHTDQDADTKKLGISDKVSYVLMVIFQGLEQIHNRAVDHHYENVCNTIMGVLGRIAIYAAKYDITLTTYPIHFIGKMTRRAQDNHLSEVPIRTSFVLTEVAKGIINETDITYAELQEPFGGIINHLDAIAKETFRQDKSTNIDVLKQPFLILKDIFANPKFTKHIDAPAIIDRLNQVLGEWDAVDMVMKTMPPIPKINTDDEETQKPEMPLM
jgi:hypothetical protein